MEMKTNSETGECITVLSTVDIRNPANPQELGAFEITVSRAKSGCPALRLFVAQDRAYVWDWNRSLSYVIDISTPAAPRHLGSAPAFDPKALFGNDFIIANAASALEIVQLTLPTRFEQIAREPTGAVRLRMSAPPRTTGRLQRSTDLKSWSDWQTVEFTENDLELSDSNPSASTSFYRIAMP